MNFAKSIVYVGLASVMLMGGCATNNKTNDRIANNDNTPLGVRYNPNVDTNRNWTNDNRNVTTRDGFNVNNTGTRNDDNNGNGFGVNNNRDFNDNQIDVADNIADKIADLKEVDTANVLVTRRNAYVAVRLNNTGNNEMTSTVQRKIAKQVRDVDNNIDNVYISENPDFYNRMTGYRNDINNGRPVSGFFNEFSDTVRRVFPNSR
ncbi:YhcN/YlaJ family sporulation lipoprotein [Lederbergia wuyishanensis]|uniref:YhcN/YlaJ family sporulation lipoprotein n=1 Tax=Lederbergia wuyishanensis TaxID=1347903 RepID=A0ABU0D511_9BACI|nr:YhcN/YlaJ family sporulation lipoprotein [Lederbergia wuyishanensis]MCJ8009579.1 YhcN/YlaJ family sporulation lipoprotein [Lederbergia wuyishanensis]MDQ0343485.1 YhcN/YlaJ family sporulation lipoprotein [Lederbergia wuyishanensis]